jgi:hypothetical protein
LEIARLTVPAKYPGRGSNPQPSASEADTPPKNPQQITPLSLACEKCYLNCYPCRNCITRIASEFKAKLTQEQLNLLLLSLLGGKDPAPDS